MVDFLALEVVVALHDSQLARYGGPAGIRDRGLLESALARPLNARADGVDDPFALAASLAYGLARNHPFLDGNKRTAWASARTFLALDGRRVIVDKAQAVEAMVQLAEGRLDEDAFARWLAGAPSA